MKNKSVDNEINLIEVFDIIWRKKIKVALIVTLTIIAALIYHKSNPSTYLAKTEITPISVFQEFKYATINSFAARSNFHFERKVKKEIVISDEIKEILEKEIIYLPFGEIDRFFLLNLFVDKLNEGEILKESIKKQNLINKEDYENDRLYENAVSKLAHSIKILPSEEMIEKEKRKVIKWNIVFETKNKETWGKILESLEYPINQEVNNYLANVTSKFLEDAKKLRYYLIEDIDQKVSNSLDQYEINIIRRLAFLKEQAKIARELNLAKNNFNQKLTVDHNSEPYYLRGYEIIEKEIELIKKRTDKKNFIKDLNKIEEEKRELISNKNIERFENLFMQSPIMNPPEFSAGKINFLSTTYEDNKIALNIFLIIATILGIIIAIFYVLIEESYKNIN